MNKIQNCVISKSLFKLLSSIQCEILLAIYGLIYSVDNIKMRDNYVNNIEEILSANEGQRNKIQFLQRERLKRDHYLSDLQDNLTLNKQTLKQYNMMGCNQKAINNLISQTETLCQKIKEYYEEYQNFNALLLMEKQMRLEDKQFYQERVIEFQNKMVDLRKYLHDKEESFTSVITRLKRYEQISQSTTQDKLLAYKKDMAERSTNQFIADLIKQRNFYKNQYEKMKKDYIVFSDMKNTIISKYKEAENILKNFQKENAVKINMLVGNIYYKMQEEKKTKWKAEPNKELIRLLKKQKLNNELLEQALNDAIQKNEQLVALKEILQKAVQRLEAKCRLIHSQNTIFALKIAEYDNHYCRRIAHSRRYYEQGQIKGLSFIIQQRLKQYAKNIFQSYQTNAKLHQQYNEKLKADVDKWGQFLCQSHKIKKEFVKQKLLVKSCSTPNMIVGIDLDDFQGDKLIIEEI